MRDTETCDLTGWLADPATDTGINFYDGTRWERVTYVTFAGQVLGAARRLRQLGVGRGDRVALALSSGPWFARYFFGAIAIGATPTPIAPPGYQGTVDYGEFAAGRLSVLEPTCVVAETTTIALLRRREETGRLRGHYVDAAEPVPDGGVELLNPLAKDDLALIQFTSGTSSAPRGVTLTSAAVLAQVDIVRDLLGGFVPGLESFSSWLPLHHDMGLIGLFVTPVMHNAELWLMRPEHFVRRPADWLATFGRHGALRSATPNFALGQLVRRLRPADLDGMDFSQWRTLVVGSDRINYPVLDACYRLLAPYGLPASTLTPAYGMAEATLAVTGTRLSAPPSAVIVESMEFSSGTPVRVTGRHQLGSGQSAGFDQHTVVSCGVELAGVEVTVRDEAGGLLPDGHVGELLVRSPALSQGYLTQGYLGDPVENERFTLGGYRTGDLGFRLDDEVYVLGRVGDSVKVRGRFVTAEDVELAVARVLDLAVDRLAVVVGDTADDPAVLVIVQQKVAGFTVDRVAGVLASFGLAPERLLVLHMAKLAVPRTTSGKPRRAELWRRLTAGTLAGDVSHRGSGFPPVAPGGKGHHLAVMRRAGLPVPPFVVLSAEELAAGEVGAERIGSCLAEITAAAPAGAVVGFAVRSSPARSMPGMLDTLLCLGTTEADLAALTDRLGGERAAWQVLLTQASHLCRFVAGVDPGPSDAEPKLQWEQLKRLFSEATGQPYPADSVDQVRVAVTAVRRSWHAGRAKQYRRAHGIADISTVAVVVQAMVYGTAAEVSGSGVVFSHNPLTGESGLFGEFLPVATGEGLVSGTRTPQAVDLLRERAGHVYEELARHVDLLYRRLRDMVDVEFVVENGRLWLVQVRPATAPPHVLNRVRTQAWQDGVLTATEALRLLDVDALFQPLPARVRPEETDRLLAVGLPASPGAATGLVVTSTAEAMRYDAGSAVLLRPDTEPDDFAGIANSAAVVTLNGGSTSHAAVVTRELGVPAVVGAEIVDQAWLGQCSVDSSEVTVCGTSGRVWAGVVPITPSVVPDRPTALLAAAGVDDPRAVPEKGERARWLYAQRRVRERVGDRR
jgi:acyl-CoA synthetase (AMP-forming)/AMP-acid ligase II/phosphohistidine swiveling domain-containing protein